MGKITGIKKCELHDTTIYLVYLTTNHYLQVSGQIFHFY